MNKSILLPVSLISLISLFGWSKIKSHGETIVGEVRDEINRISPGPHEAERIRNLLDDRARQLLKQNMKVTALERKADMAHEEASALAAEIDEQKAILARADEILRSGSPESEIGGRTYTIKEIEADVMARLHAIKNLETRRNTKHEISIELHAAVLQQRERLAAAEVESRKKRAELDTLDVRLESANLQSLARSLTDDLLREGLDGYDEVVESFDSYKARVEEEEVLAGVQSDTAGGNFAVNWSETGVGVDLLDEIAQVIGRKATTSNSGTSSQDGPPHPPRIASAPFDDTLLERAHGGSLLPEHRIQFGDE